MSDTQKIDWTQPVETVDGMLMTYFPERSTAQHGYPHWVEGPEGTYISSFYSESGKPWSSYKPDLRNVAPKEVEWGPEFMQASVVRNGDYIGLTPAKLVAPTRTALEQRMEDLVRMVAGNNYASLDAQAEARAILAELEPVDGDMLIARSIVGNCANYMRNCLYGTQIVEGKHDDSDVVKFALKALRARALERGE